jgi:hypothetical protein
LGNRSDTFGSSTGSAFEGDGITAAFEIYRYKGETDKWEDRSTKYAVEEKLWVEGDGLIEDDRDGDSSYASLR